MSGSGKTTISRGLMALFTRHGYTVQPFKCGPDYIDTKFHETVCGRPSVNLDTFMATSQHIRQLYGHYGHDADVCVIEGMMGLYDGYDHDRGSSAEISCVLGLPVILVVDARSAAYSMAALLSGFIHFRDDVRIEGVIYNKVGSARHAEMLRQVADELGIKCYGCLPKSNILETASRYLGLDFSNSAESEDLVRMMDEHIDWESLLELKGTPPQECPLFLKEQNYRKVLVARNKESFSFLYQETLDSFHHVEFFDPEKDVPHLKHVDLLYLPGGYPEKHLETLVSNEKARTAICDYAERGGHVIAECGGMMYLCQTIVTDDGEYPMCGVLPYKITARTDDRKLSLGYRRFLLDGHEYRGHEFHYTQFLGTIPASSVQVFNAKDEPVPTPVLRYKNVFASYTHLYRPVEK